MSNIRKVYLVDLEKVPSRYTWEWHSHFPQVLKDNGFDVEVIGDPNYQVPASSGGFLNFVETNKYKADQVSRITELFSKQLIEDDSIFLFADAWHPGVINTKYMIDLTGVDSKIAVLWHAGSYIEEDILGQKIRNKGWSYSFERSVYHSSDFNFFATKWHLEHFESVLGCSGSSYLTGWPMEYVRHLKFPDVPKRDVVVFPHRISPEKQVHIFDELATRMPEYEFVVCQRHDMTKEQYHRTLSEAKVMFSAATLETLGICQNEALAAKCLPMVPNRLSYTEMYKGDSFLYPSEWTLGDVDYESLTARIKYLIENYELLIKVAYDEYEYQTKTYFECQGLLDVLAQ